MLLPWHVPPERLRSLRDRCWRSAESPRVSATILVGTYLLDTVGERIAADKATSKEDKRERTERTLIRTSMLGGALLASVDTAGKPGLWWRTQHAAEDLWSSVEGTSKQAMSALGVD